MDEETSMDQSFLKKVNEAIEQNFEKEGFCVDDLAREVGISRSHLHRKLQSYAQPPASQMIKEFRLRKAHELLSRQVGTVAEIAYRVGFNSPSYFNTCFHEFYGYPPGHVKDIPIEPQGRSSKYFSRVWLFAFLVVAFIASLFWLYFSVWQSVAHKNEMNSEVALVVLPFTDMNQSDNEQYFADGMTETLINYLSKIKSLKVISRTTSMSYRNSDKTIPKIAKELDVYAVVEGSVLRENDEVRITAQLILGKEDEHMWSNQYDRKISNILSIHCEVAQEIANQIQINLSPNEELLISQAPQVIPEAYEAYLMGRYHLYRLTPDHYEQAYNYFQKALEIDPEYSFAHAGTALVWLHRGLWSGYEPLEVAEYGKNAALKAISIDANNMEAYQALAAVYSLYEWNWEPAFEAYERIVELAPNLTEARLLYGDMLLSLEQQDLAMYHIRTATALDPMNPFSYSILGWALYTKHQYEEAIRELQKSVEMSPTLSLSLRCLWSSYDKLEQTENALKYAKLFYKAQGLPQVENDLSEEYAKGGYQYALLYAAKQLEAYSKHTFVPSMRIARLYAQGGDVGKAIELLQKSYQERFPSMMSIKVDPDWEPLKSSSSFQQLIEMMNFPEVTSENVLTN